MSNRFVDNKTHLDADTLNAFEDDLRAASIPVYNAVFEENTSSIKYKAYRISEVEWNKIPVGTLFSVIFDQSTQGDTDEVIGLRFGTSDSSYYIFYSMPDYALTFANTQYVRVNSRKYLIAHRPYVMKKIAASGSSTPLIALMDHFETAKFGSTLDISGGSIELKNLDGTAISSVNLPAAEQTVRGGVKVWVSGSTLNISTD